MALLDGARASFKAKDYGKSIELLDKLLADCTDPDIRQKALSLRGYAFLQKGDIARAKVDFWQAGAIGADAKTKADALERYAYICLREKNDQDARAGFRELARVSKDPAVQADALLRSSYIALRDDRMTSHDKAALFREVADRFAGTAKGREATLRYARLISSMPDESLDARRTAFREVADKYPGTPEAKAAEISLASVEWRESQNNPSVEKKQEVEQMYRTLQANASTGAQRGNAAMNVAALTLEIERLQAASDSDHAIDYGRVIGLCDQALASPEIKPADAATAALIRAESLHYSGQLADAGAGFDKLIDTWSSDQSCATQVAFAAYMQAMNWVDQKQSDKALEAFQRVVSNYADVPNFAGNNIAASSLTWIATLSIRTGDFPAAQQAIAQIEQKYPDVPEAAQVNSLKSLLQIKQNNGGK